jgi:midasin
MLKKVWRRLVVEPLSRSELQTVIDSRFPSLSPLTDKLLDAYYLLNENQSNTRLTVNDRSLSPRDFFKWCNRIAAEFRLDNTSLTSINSQLSIFQDALDCFVASVSNGDRRLQLAEDIGAKLNMIKAKAEFYCNSFKPVFNISEDSVGIGRVSLKRFKINDIVAKSTFSWTRNSSVLLERLAACVRQLESVLLVGETGTGKTSSVQYLAQLLGHRLLVINLNQQSDSADLLGGYKPVDLKWKISPIRHEFERLFEETFSLQQNAKFLSHVSTCFANRRWGDLLRLMTHSQQSAVKRCKPELRPAWEQLGFQLQQLRLQIRHADSALAFSFVEGSLVKALKQGNPIIKLIVAFCANDYVFCRRLGFTG